MVEAWFVTPCGLQGRATACQTSWLFSITDCSGAGSVEFEFEDSALEALPSLDACMGQGLSWVRTRPKRDWITHRRVHRNFTKRVASERWALICSAQRTTVIDVKKDRRLFMPAMTAKWLVARRFCEKKIAGAKTEWEQRSYVAVWRSHPSGDGFHGSVDDSHLANAVNHCAGCPLKLRACPLDDGNTQALPADDRSLGSSKIPIIQKRVWLHTVQVGWKSVTTRAQQTVANVDRDADFKRLARTSLSIAGTCMPYVPTTSTGTVSNSIK